MTAQRVRNNRSQALTLPLLTICVAMSSNLVVAGGLKLDEASLDGITAGRAELQVNANAEARGSNPVASTNTAAQVVSIESSLSGGVASGTAGAGGAVACCESSTTGVTGTTSNPGSTGTAVGSVQTQEVNGLSITIGGAGSVGVTP